MLMSLVSTCLALPFTSLCADLEIRQENFRYQMPFVQAVFAETFVISPVSNQPSEKVVISSKPAPIPPDPTQLFAHPISVRFQIDSAEIVPEQKNKMLSQLQKFKVSQNASLSVNGFTCQMGTNEFNAWLSEERAKAVAKLLEKEGYTVVKIEGKGASDLISEYYAPSNRRVEITSTHTRQSQISTKEETP